MDIATVIGLALCNIAIIVSILLGGSLSVFVDPPSVMMVFGGIAGAIFIRWPMDDVKKVASVYMKTLFYTSTDPKQTIGQIENLAETARRESVFALEKVPIEDPFLKKAMVLAADNRPPEVISAILQLEIDAMSERHKVGQEILNGIAADGPAFGMIGTLVGLVLMLQNLSDPSAIGPSMAVALLTTFYGAVIANVFGGPMAAKLAMRSKSEATKMSIIIAGTLGIVAGENPRLIKEKLNGFLAPKQRDVEKKEE
jgi:chemotaxis protein MotA